MSGPTRFKHQIAGTKYLLENKKCLLADSPGLGKTAQVIDMITQAKVRRSLIVVPNQLKSDWVKALEVFSSGTRVEVVKGPYLERARVLREGKPGVVILNYELLYKHSEDILEGNFNLVAFDEAHKLKNRNAQVTRGAKRVGKKVGRVVFITGTPLTKSVVDLFPLLNIILPKEFSSYWKFVNRYCFRVFNGFGYTIVDRKEDDPALQELRGILAQYMLRRTTDQVFPDFVDLHVFTKIIDTSEGQRKIYQDLKKSMLAQVGGTELLVVNAVSLMTRLKQVLLDPELAVGPVEVLQGAKVEALLDILADLSGSQLVVFTQFASAIRPLITRLAEHGYSAVEYSGQVSDTVANDNEAKWKAGEAQVLVSGIDKGGIGKTWTQARYAVMLDKKWLPYENEQARKRLHRIGQEHPVVVWEFLTKDTLEEKIEKVLSERQNLIEGVITRAMLEALL